MARALRRFLVVSLRSHWILYLVVGLSFLAGVLIGAWSAGGLEASQAGELQEYVDQLVADVNGLNVNPGEQFVAVTYNNVLLIAAIYIAGLSVIGIPAMLGLLFVRGFAIGFAVWFLVTHMGWPGVWLAGALILPQSLVLIPAALFAGVAALSFSVLLIHRGFDPGVRIWPNFVRYSAMLAAAALVAVGAGLVESFVTPWLWGMLFAAPE